MTSLLKFRILTSLFNVACELSQSMDKDEFSNTAKNRTLLIIELCLKGWKSLTSIGAIVFPIRLKMHFTGRQNENGRETYLACKPINLHIIIFNNDVTSLYDNIIYIIDLPSNTCRADFSWTRLGKSIFTLCPRLWAVSG